jgi:hypothetical protein
MTTKDMIHHLLRGQKMTRKVSNKIALRLGHALEFEEAARRAAVKSLTLSHDGNRCKVCGEAGGEHTHDCQVNPVIDIAMMSVDWEHHGPQYLKENGG